MPTTTPRQDVRRAFKTILDGAGLGVTIYDRMPYAGAGLRSVVLTLISGSASAGVLGLHESPTERALEARHRIQVDCYHDIQAECDKLADAVEQAIADHTDTLRDTYDIHDVRKIVDSDTAPPDPTLKQARVLMDFEFSTHRAVT